jgi:hypothetical protein
MPANVSHLPAPTPTPSLSSTSTRLSCAAFHVLTNARCVLSVASSALTSRTPTLAPSFVKTTFFFSILRTPRSASSFEYM